MVFLLKSFAGDLLTRLELPPSGFNHVSIPLSPGHHLWGGFIIKDDKDLLTRKDRLRGKLLAIDTLLFIYFVSFRWLPQITLEL